TEGSTPLHFAAANGHLGVLALLLDQGADCRKPDKSGVAPLMLAENLGQTNAATVLRDWANKNPNGLVLASTPSVLVAPNNLKVRRSLDNFLPRPWKGSLFDRLFPRRARSSASIPQLGQNNFGFGDSGTRRGGDSENLSPHGGRPYQHDSRDSSLLSLGSPLRPIKTNESRSPGIACGEEQVRTPASLEQPDLVGQMSNTETQTGTQHGMSEAVDTTCIGETLIESELESSAQEDNARTENTPNEYPVLGQQDETARASISIPQAGPLLPLNFQHSAVSKSMSAHEIVQQLSQHGCQNITNDLDTASCGARYVSCGGFGDVYCGSLSDGSQVAIKTVRELVPPCNDGSKSLKVHGDLKAVNIVISDQGTPMLTDFGNAVLQEYTLNFTATTQKNSLSARWTAPELLYGGSYSVQADVYALGMTMLETITGKVPFSEKKNNLAVIASVIGREIPTRPEEVVPPKSQCGDILWSLLKSCWEHDPTKRPNAVGVVTAVRVQPEPAAPS
ncbi:hypothetical protein FRC07_000679, partial [Ceratobasidium sp. 392]